MVEKPSKAELEVWNKILSDRGLSMMEGSGHGKLLHVGGNNELAIIEKYLVGDSE